MPKQIIETRATSFDTAQAVEVIWEALGALREDLIPEGDESYDEQWEEICTAMAWIEEALGHSNADGHDTDADWAECESVPDDLRQRCLSPDVPDGYETVMGYYARYNPWSLRLGLTAPESTLRDGYWLMHRANERGIKVVHVQAPECFRNMGIEKVNAYPLSLLRERMEG